MERTPISHGKTTAALLLLLAALTLAMFWPATGYDYVMLDDDQYIANNPHVLTGFTAANIHWAFTRVYEDWWLPMLWISFMADTELFGPEPFGYHLTNILLHTANVVLLFWVLFRLTGARGLSVFVAAFFALHPLRVESVAWITARKDVLSGLFFFLSLLAYVRHVERPGEIRFWILFVLMLLGLMSKAILIILPFVLLLLDYWPLRRAGDPWGPDAWPGWRPLLVEKIPLFLLSAGFILINLRTHITGSGAQAHLPIWTRLGLIPPNYWTYLGKIFWPIRLSILYPEHDVVNGAISAVSAAGLLVLTVWLFRHRQKAPYEIVGWLWFLLALFPVIRGVRLGLAAYADRFAYLPSIGLSIALVWGGGALAQKRPGLKTPLISLGVLLLAACVALTALRLPDWRNSDAMFSRLITFAPENGVALNSYGRVLLERGDVEESLDYFSRAAALFDSIAPLNYAEALIRLGREPEAIDWLKKVLATSNLDHPDFHTLLGVAYLNEDQAAEAIPHLRRAVQTSLNTIGIQIALVRASYETHDEEATRKAIQDLHALGYLQIRDFDSLGVYYAALWKSGKVHHSWLFFRNNLRRQPDNIVLLNNAAWLLATTQNPPAPPEEALRYARHAVELATIPHPDILDTLAAALAANHQFDEAIATARQAIALAQKGNDPATAAQIEQRLDTYVQNRLWRE